MNLAARHFENATFHFDLVQNIYKKFMKSMNIPSKIPFNVMDIGCGSGRLLNEILNPLLPENCENLIGTDINEQMIEYCKLNREKCGNSSRIHYEILDISTKNLPGKFKNNFHLLFSSYCFMYVEDISQALKNCNEMLKPNGEILFTFLAKENFVQCTYQKMYHRYDIWKPYTEKFANFVPLFLGENCDDELLTMFNSANLQVIAHEFLDGLKVEGYGKQLFNLVNAMDKIYPKIPNELKENYRKDYLETMSDLIDIDLTNEKILSTIQGIPMSSVIIHAKKPSK